MKSHRPPLKRCATNDGMGGRRCSWGLINMAARVRQGRRRGPLPVPAPSLGCERPKISLGFDPTGGGYYPRPDKRQETHMALLGLGYAGFGSDALDDWRQFGTGLVGLQAVERGNSLLAFRMDDRKQRIVIDRAMGEGTRFFGWEVADAAALDALAARLEQASVRVTAEPRTLADARRVRSLISFRDPAGNRLEAFYGPEIDETPFSPGRSISGFRTGPLGLGHAVLTVENIDPVMAFYVDVLGFGLSDYIEKPFRAYFFIVNARHLSLRMVEIGR